MCGYCEDAMADELAEARDEIAGLETELSFQQHQNSVLLDILDTMLDGLMELKNVPFGLMVDSINAMADALSHVKEDDE